MIGVESTSSFFSPGKGRSRLGFFKKNLCVLYCVMRKNTGIVYQSTYMWLNTRTPFFFFLKKNILFLPEPPPHYHDRLKCKPVSVFITMKVKLSLDSFAVFFTEETVRPSVLLVVLKFIIYFSMRRNITQKCKRYLLIQSPVTFSLSVYKEGKIYFSSVSFMIISAIFPLIFLVLLRIIFIACCW